MIRITQTEKMGSNQANIINYKENCFIMSLISISLINSFSNAYYKSQFFNSNFFPHQTAPSWRFRLSESPTLQVVPVRYNLNPRTKQSKFIFLPEKNMHI